MNRKQFQKILANVFAKVQLCSGAQNQLPHSFILVLMFPAEWCGLKNSFFKLYIAHK